MKLRNTNAVIGYVVVTVLLLSAVMVHSTQWALSQFPVLAPVITFETGSTGLPNIGGLSLSGGDSTFDYDYHTGYDPYMTCIGNQFFGNFNGNTYLDIVFTQPQQAVGAYIINADTFYKVTGVMEVVYDNSNNILDSASEAYPPLQIPAAPPVFLGLGETKTNIYKVEWRYTGAAGYFGVDNVIYSPGPLVVLTNIQSSPGNLSFNFQTLPGHTNWIQLGTNLNTRTWSNLTNVLGDGSRFQINVSTTNSPASFFRVQIY